MAKHWKVARKYEDSNGEITVDDKKWVSRSESRGRLLVSSGLWQKVGEWEDESPAVAAPAIREISSQRRSKPEKKPVKG